MYEADCASLDEMASLPLPGTESQAAAAIEPLLVQMEQEAEDGACAIEHLSVQGSIDMGLAVETMDEFAGTVGPVEVEGMGKGLVN